MWMDVRREHPRLADIGEDRLLQPGVVLVATIRRDGTPRVSPVEPLLMDGELWLSMLYGSTKARDLQRDPRILVHSVVCSRDGSSGEFKVRGRAREVLDEPTQCRYAGEVAQRLGWDPTPGRFHLFTVDISDITYIRFVDATGEQFVQRWPSGEQFRRPATSATSLGPREPTTQALG